MCWTSAKSFTELVGRHRTRGIVIDVAALT